MASLRHRYGYTPLGATEGASKMEYLEQRAKRNHKIGVFLGVTSLVALGALAVLGHLTHGFGRTDDKTTTLKASSSSTDDDAAVKQEIDQAFAIIDGWEVGDGIVCSGVSYAYCGPATCHNVNDQTALCGCTLQTNTVGKSSFSKASMVLLRSAIFRDAVFEIESGTFSEVGQSAFCSRPDDGPILKQAGYGPDYGPPGLMTPDWKTGSSSSALRAPSPSSSADAAAALFPSSPSSNLANTDAYLGSCMGAPCKVYDWGTNCGVVCVCTEFPSDDDADDAVEGCFKNTVGSPSATYPWSQSVAGLMVYSDSVKHTLDNLDTIADFIIAQNDGAPICEGSCTVES